MLDLVVSPGFIPSAEEIMALRPGKLRSIIYKVSDCDRVANLGVPYIVTVNNECAEVQGWRNWEGAIKMIASRPRKPWGVEIGNEFDLFWQSNPNDVPPSFAADLINRASPILRSAGIHVIATSVASETWPIYLDQMANLCRDAVDYFNIHPYGQRPEGWGTPGWMHGDLSETIFHAYNIAGKPIYCTEIGVKIGDAGGEEQAGWWLRAAAKTFYDLGQRVCAGGAYFAWRDQVGAPHERGPQAFGLLREDGSRRPSWHQFADLPNRPTEELPMFTVGDGVKQEMAKYGDEPATDEIYHPIGAPAGKHQYSETFGTSGRRYVFIFSTNQTVLYEPEGI